jgi:phosphonate transport system substrate-binding protein
MQRHRRAPLVALSLVILALVGVLPRSAAGGSSKTDPATTPLRIAVAAMFSPEETLSVYQELMDYIANKLGRPVELKQRRTYQEVNDMLGTGKLDAAILCSGPYVHARRQYGIQLLAVPVIHGSPTYHSYIIVPHNSAATSLEDLRGKRFAFTDPLSTSGYLYPVYALVRKGQQPATFFAKTLFTYSHDNSIEAVVEGVVDGAAVDSLIYDYLLLQHPDLASRMRILHSSPPMGAQPVGIPRTLAPDTKQALRDLFLNMDQEPDAQKILKQLGVDRFIAGSDNLYDGIRAMQKAVVGVRLR